MLLTLDDLSPLAKPHEQAVACGVCRNDKLEILLSPDEVAKEQEWLKRFYEKRQRNGGHAKDKLSFTQCSATCVVRCANCGTVFRNPQPKPSVLASRYANDHYDESTLKILEANQAPFFADRVEEFRILLRPGADVLEVGSFTGAFLKAAEDAGWHATGMDIGKEPLRYMRNAGLRVIKSDISNSDLAANSRDAIFIWNTFDQLPLPHRALDRVAETLKPSGLLVVRIPNGNFAAGCVKLLRDERRESVKERIRCAQAYNNFVTFPYLVGYTPDSLTALLKDHGFRVLGIRGDTLVRTSDGDTRPFAKNEEQRYKKTTMHFCRQLEERGDGCFYPWLDVIAQRNPNRTIRIPRN